MLCNIHMYIPVQMIYYSGVVSERASELVYYSFSGRCTYRSVLRNSKYVTMKFSTTRTTHAHAHSTPLCSLAIIHSYILSGLRINALLTGVNTHGSLHLLTIVGMEVVSGYRPSPSGSFAHAPELKASGQGHVILVPSVHPAHNAHVTPAHAQLPPALRIYADSLL